MLNNRQYNFNGPYIVVGLVLASYAYQPFVILRGITELIILGYVLLHIWMSK